MEMIWKLKNWALIADRQNLDRSVDPNGLNDSQNLAAVCRRQGKPVAVTLQLMAKLILLAAGRVASTTPLPGDSKFAMLNWPGPAPVTGQRAPPVVPVHVTTMQTSPAVAATVRTLPLAEPGPELATVTV